MLISRKGYEYFELGHGNLDDVILRLPSGTTWTIICDDDAAIVGAQSCWFAAHGDMDKIVKDYEESGGTVSFCTEITIPID